MFVSNKYVIYYQGCRGYFILLQSKILKPFQENDANIRVEEWNPANPSGNEFTCFTFWSVD
jgi:hypothetical protein